MSVITNTTVISNFASIDRLIILKGLFGNVHITTEVYEEIQKGLEEGYQFYANFEQNVYPFAQQGWLYLTSLADNDELLSFGKLLSKLHPGEASCLAIAQKRNWLLLTDDKAARSIATEMGIRLSGTIGCLVLSVERKLTSLQEANLWLNLMIDLGYRSPVIDLTALLSDE